MKKLVTAGLLFFVSITSHAYQVQLNGTNNATGILGLGIGGTVYDVVFEYVPGPHTTPETTDVFATPDANLTGAQAAVTAINAALNTSPAITVGPDAYSYIIPYLFNNATCDTLCGKRGSSGFATGSWDGPTQADIKTDNGITFARFTPASPVPLPPAVFLFSSGLALLGWVRRRSILSRSC